MTNNTFEKLVIIFMACVLCCIITLTLCPIAPANTLTAEAREGDTVATIEQRLYEGTTLTPAIIAQPMDVYYCDSCGEPFCIGKPSPFTHTQFDDGTCGYACGYCQAFFALDQRDRDILREHWSEY